MFKRRKEQKLQLEESLNDSVLLNPEVLEKEKIRNTAGRKLKRQCIGVKEKERVMDRTAKKKTEKAKS